MLFFHEVPEFRDEFAEIHEAWGLKLALRLLEETSTNGTATIVGDNVNTVRYGSGAAMLRQSHLAQVVSAPLGAGRSAATTAAAPADGARSLKKACQRAVSCVAAVLPAAHACSAAESIRDALRLELWLLLGFDETIS